MSNSSSRLLGNTSEAVTPNSYTTEYIRLTNNSSQVINISDLVQKIEIIESLYKPTVEVIILIADATNFLEDNKLGGNEKIELKIKRSPLKGSSQNKTIFKLEVYIAEIFGYIKKSPGMQLYQFRCVSKHLYHNQVKTIKRSFQGSIGKLVKDICAKDLMIKNSYINTETKDIIKGIYPNVRPIHAVNWLMRNAFLDSSPFYFYETAKDGVVFDSHINCIEKPFHSSYNNIPGFTAEPGSPEGYEEERKRIRSLNSPLGLSKLVAAGSGAYASTLYTLDISTKEYKKSYFNHGSTKFKTLNSKKSFSDNIKLFDQGLPSLKDSKSYFVSLNSNAYQAHKNYHAPLSPTLLKSESYNSNMEFMTHQIEINGDFDISVGKTIELKLIKSSSYEHLEDPNVFIDKYSSGKYLITEVYHSFDDKFVQLLTVKKDSSEVDLNA